MRPGIVYTSTGTGRIGLPTGRCTIYAGRGFEYSLDSTEVIIEAGETERRRLSIRREVPIAGCVACDSHDVGRHFVGQGRTYIHCDDHDPGSIDVQVAVKSFIEGRVMVSYGLLAELMVNGKYRSGDVVRFGDDHVNVEVRVLGPHWVQATRVRLFSNGRQIRDE